MSVQLLVLGIGNVLLGDEGAGVRVVERLSQDRHLFGNGVELVDGGTMGLELLPYLEGKSHLFIVDAVKSIGKPGAIVVRELEDPPAYFRQKLSPHQLGLAEVMAVAALQDCLPQQITLFGIVPEDVSTGLDLSPGVGAAVDRLAPILTRRIINLLESHDQAAAAA